MSAFTECDNPFSTESDALEQCLKKYVCVCVCVNACVCVCVNACVCVCLNCECNSAGISQSGLSWAGDPEKEQTEMEVVKGGRKKKKKKRERLIFIDMRIMMLPNRGSEQRLVDEVCVCVYVGEDTFQH